MAKRFFFACAGILCLALAYHLGASSATAQAPSRGTIRFVEAWGDHVWIVNDADDVYSLDREKLRPVAEGAGWSKYRLDAVK